MHARYGLPLCVCVCGSLRGLHCARRKVTFVIIGRAPFCLTYLFSVCKPRAVLSVAMATPLELPLSLDAACCMSLDHFFCALDNDGDAETVSQVVAAFAQQRVATVKRFASTPVRHWFCPFRPCRFEFWSGGGPERRGGWAARGDERPRLRGN